MKKQLTKDLTKALTDVTATLAGIKGHLKKDCPMGPKQIEGMIRQAREALDKANTSSTSLREAQKFILRAMREGNTLLGGTSGHHLLAYGEDQKVENIERVPDRSIKALCEKGCIVSHDGGTTYRMTDLGKTIDCAKVVKLTKDEKGKDESKAA